MITDSDGVQSRQDLAVKISETNRLRLRPRSRNEKNLMKDDVILTQSSAADEQSLADRVLIGVPCALFGLLLLYVFGTLEFEPERVRSAAGLHCILAAYSLAGNLFLVVAYIKFFGHTPWIKAVLKRTRTKLIFYLIATLVLSAGAWIVRVM